jgi:hypothetical protein
VSLTLVVLVHLSEQLKNETARIVTDAVGTVVETRDGVGVRPAVGTRDGTTDSEFVWFKVELLDGTELGLDDELELELEIDEKDDRELEGDEVRVELGVDDGSND